MDTIRDPKQDEDLTGNGSGLNVQELKEKLFKNLRESRTWQLAAVLLAIFIFILVSSALRGPSKRTHDKAPVDAQREVYKEQDLKRVIDQMIQENAKKQSSAKPERHQRKAKSYDTDMQVFIYKEKEEKASVEKTRSKKEKETFRLPPGTRIPAYLSGTLFSFNVVAPVTVVVAKGIENLSGKVVIPKGTKLLGKAGLLKSLNRVNVNLDEMVLPDGKVVRVKAIALSDDGSAGIQGKVKKHSDKKIFKALGETALSGLGLFMGARQGADPYSLQDQMAMNFAENMGDQAKRDLRSVRIETSVTVESHTPVQVLLLEGI